MRTYDDEIELAECILNDAKEEYENSEFGEIDITGPYYDDIDELNIKREDKDMYKIRLDFILIYTDQY
jgi:hypothetical protein